MTNKQNKQNRAAAELPVGAALSRHAVAFDISLGRPACVLIAAGLRASTAAARRFPAESWLLFPTEQMGVYMTTDAQLDALVERVTTTFRQSPSPLTQSALPTPPSFSSGGGG